jgi:DNA polymerase-3 subunit epsilon
VETTGLNPRFGDRVCEIGIVLAQGGQIVDTYASLVNPQRPISEGAAAVNGLTDEMVAGAPLFAEIADEVCHRVEGNVLICHNAPFDLGFLQMEFSRLGRAWRAEGVLDTLALARRFGNFPSNSLGRIATALGINVQGAHRALADALTTFQLWQYFEEQLGPAVHHYLSPFSLPEASTAGVVLPPALQEALDQQADVEILYIDRSGNETRRLIRPQEVFVEFGTVYLVAYCHLRQDRRQFRLDRIISICSRGSK